MKYDTRIVTSMHTKSASDDHYFLIDVLHA